MSTYPMAVPPPRSHARRSLRPLPDSPWLVPRMPPPALLPVVLTWWLGAVFVLRTTTLLLTAALIVGGLAVCGISLALALRAQIQVCPECLVEMGRGAHRCPSCGFTPPS